MTVQSCNIISRRASNSLGIRTYQHVYQVVTDSSSDDEYVVGSYSGLPRIGQQHPSDSNAWCVDISPELERDTKINWMVGITYSSANEIAQNPLMEPSVIEWDGENFDEVAVYDRSGHAILNSAGDYYADAMRERSRRVVTVVKNIGNVPSWILEAEDAVNSSQFTLDGKPIAANKAKLSAPKIGRWQQRNGVWYREMTMVIKLNKDGWNLQPLDAGFRYRNSLGQLVRAYSEGDGTDVTTPVLLDGAGGLLSNPIPSTASYGDFEVYPEYNFNLLPLR